MKHPELSEEQLAHLKLELINKRAKLKEQLEQLLEDDTFADPDRVVGNAEDADEASEQTLHLENDLKEEAAKKTLGAVEKALAKMEAEEGYGLCEVCNEPIDVARLQALPEAQTCVTHSS